MHLNIHERERIAVWKSAGLSLRAIARKLGRPASTVSRELNRNGPRYWPHKAQEKAEERLAVSHKRPRLKSRVMHYEIEQMLIKGWSPELIAGRIRTHRPDLSSVCPEAIYQWIYIDRPDLIGHLARAHRKRKKRWKAKQNKTRIPERKSIEERPEVVNQRKEPGHWESDLLVGSGKAALQVAVERQSRLTRLGKIANKTAQASRQALEQMLSPMPKAWRRSITYDNGSENVEHLLLNKTLKTTSWFCQPYHSWEKGQVENTNGLIRRFVPKRSNLDRLPEDKVRSVEEWLNDRPRKVLDFKTPKEVFNAGVALAP
jgi:IS30 family transposase